MAIVGGRSDWRSERSARRPEKKSAPGSPKRHRATLSAATGEVLTRFARRRPSDLRHLAYSRTVGRSEGRKGDASEAKFCGALLPICGPPTVRLSKNRPLPLLHAPELPGLGDDAAEEEDERGVVEPEHEEHQCPDRGIARGTLERREVRQVEAVEPLRELERHGGEHRGEECGA